MYKCACHSNSGSIDISILSNESGRLVKNIFFSAQRRRQLFGISVIYLFITIFDVLIFIVMAINVLIFIFLNVS